jgi:hypothetical protein
VQAPWSYFEQISAPGSLKKQEKCPAWDVSLGLTGPKVQGRQTTALREPTVYEAINDVEGYLQKSDLISTLDNCINYWVKTWDKGKTAFFVKDTFTGRRAVIHPPKDVATQGIKPLGVWILDCIVHKPRIHSFPDDAAQLRSFLIEYCPEGDNTDVPGASGFTALDFILYTLEKQNEALRATLLGDEKLPDDTHAGRRLDPRFTKFARDPSAYLEQIGAHLGPTKRICSLFRVRFIWDEDGYHDAGSHERMGIVGYPLYIKEMLA